MIAAWTTYGSFRIQSSWSWRLPSLLQVIPSLIQLVLSVFSPESPRWLIYNDRMEEAIDMLAKYHANGDRNARLVRFEVAEIQATLIEEKEHKAMQWKEFIRTRGNRYRLFILLFVGYMVQWSGNGLTSYYLAKVLDTIGITSAKSQLLINAMLSIFSVITSIFFAMLVDRAGRRGLILFGTCTMLVVFVVWTIASAINQERDFKDRGIAIAVVAMIFLLNVGYQPVGTASVLYVIESSLFSLRSKTAMIFQACGYTASVFNNFANPVAMEAITWRYYIVYCVVLAVEVLITYFFLPETKGKGLEEISEIFDGSELMTGVHAMRKHKAELQTVSIFAQKGETIEHQEVATPEARDV